MPLRFLASLLSILLLAGAGLPEKGPLPEKKPATTETEKQAGKSEEKKEEKAVEKNAPPADEKPGAAASDAKPDTVKPEARPEPVLTIKPEDQKEYAACLADLKEIGATFKEEARIDDGKGCGIDKPLTLQTVLPGITLKPEGKMRCETALELARWTKDAVLPAAKVALENEGPLTTINQASSYICRLRNNTANGKISEHARGNAIDIASFSFKNGKSIEIQPRDEDSTLAGAFQRAVTATGCLYFETVLDPGSDEAHENHLHFDVIERKGGYRYCR
ncbi:extensin family protein [Rhizobium sp. RCAM05350]|nr:extensin family protein [Rhizobium sp. RCAM05350]